MSSFVELNDKQSKHAIFSHIFKMFEHSGGLFSGLSKSQQSRGQICMKKWSMKTSSVSRKVDINLIDALTLYRETGTFIYLQNHVLKSKRFL